MRIRQRRRSQVLGVLPLALEEAGALANAALPNETGGILLGYRADGKVMVERFLEVPDEPAEPTSYGRRHAAAEEALGRVLGSEPQGSPLGYVGEWHSHPLPFDPSARDLREFRRSARATSPPIALVVLAHGPSDGSWIPRAWVALRWSIQPAEIEEATTSLLPGGEK